MKIDFSFKISLGVLIPALVLGVAILLIFSHNYHVNAEELKNLNKKSAELQRQLHESEHYGQWTLDYYRIEKTFEYVAGKKIPLKTRQILTERLWRISKNYDIDPILILAIVLQESRGNPNTRGRYQSGAESGAYGLMQLKLETAQTLARKFGIRVETSEDLMKPDVNMILGTAYLLRLIAHYDDVRNAVIAYNLGQGKVDRLLADGRRLPTKYYEGVISKYKSLEIALDSTLINHTLR